jgi:hypothetical protein
MILLALKLPFGECSPLPMSRAGNRHEAFSLMLPSVFRFISLFNKELVKSEMELTLAGLCSLVEGIFIGPAEQT